MILKTIIDRLNQRVEVSNIFDRLYGLCELTGENGWVNYIGNGEAIPVTNYDAKVGTLFWARRGKVNISKIDSLRVSGCKQMYSTKFNLSAFAVVKKNHVPCDAEDAADWIASRVYKLVSGRDYGFKEVIDVVSYEVIPVGYTVGDKTLPENLHYATVVIELLVEIVSGSEDTCYDICDTGDIPLPPDFLPCNPCLTEVAVDGVTIGGNGTEADPLYAIGGGGGSLIVKDEGTNVSTNTTTLNFTGAGVTASLTSPGVVEVNIPSGGGGGGVTAVTGSAPIASSGGATPDISITQATTVSDGYLSATDFNTFDGKQDALTAGTGIDLTGNIVTNTAPDQIVSLLSGTDINVTGTYPNFTIDNTNPDQVVTLTGGTAISTSGTYPNFTIDNTAPDQIVSLTAGTDINITGTYPSFTIASTATGGMQGGTASGTDTYTVSIPGVTSYNTNDAYAIGFTNANTGASTLNINGLGAVNISKNNVVPIIGGDIAANQQFIAIYDGTNFQLLGVAPNQMFAYITNADSVTINRGQPVYAFGATGDRMTVKLANNTSEATSSKTVGLVFSSSIAPNQKGYIITQGVIDGINTNAYTAGDTLYVGNTAGALTNTMPFAPNHLTRIGIVERANAGNGQIYVFVQNGFQLDELSDVDITTTPLANNQFLVYTTGVNNLWKNRTLGNVLGGTTSQYLRGDGSLATFPTIPTGTVTSVGLTMPAAFSVANSPVTTSGTLAVTATGTTAQYIRGDGTLATLPAAPTIYKSTVDGTGITGVAIEQISASQLIPANTFSVGDIIEVTWRVTKTGTASIPTTKLYVNTSASLAGAIQLAVMSFNFNNSNGNTLQRFIAIKAANNSQVIGSASSSLSEFNQFTSITAANIDWTVNQYIIFMTQLQTATADVVRTSFYKIAKS